MYTDAEKKSYCVGLNCGISQSNGDFILCLNDDVILDEKFIEKAIIGFTVSSKIGMVDGKVFRFDGITLDSTGLSLNLYRSVRERGYGTKKGQLYNRAGYIFGVSGAVAFYRRAMLEDLKMGVEYFDSDFRFFY